MSCLRLGGFQFQLWVWVWDRLKVTVIPPQPHCQLCRILGLSEWQEVQQQCEP